MPANPNTPVTVTRYATLIRETADRTFLQQQQDRTKFLIQTSIPEWNKLLGGVGRWYIVLTGAQKSGKTIIGANLSMELARGGWSVAYLSGEMDNELMGPRIASPITKIPLSRFRDLNLTENDFTQMEVAATDIDHWKAYFFYGDNTLGPVESIYANLKPDAIFIDYLGLWDDEDPDTRTIYQRISNLSRYFKQMNNRKPQNILQDRIADIETLKAHLEAQRGILGEDFCTRAIAEISQIPIDDIADDEVARSKTAMITFTQTSKDSQRRGKLDATSAKDSNAPAEDADVYGVINTVAGGDGEPIPGLRDIEIVASRISDVGTISVFLNTQTASWHPANVLFSMPLTQK